MRVGNDQDVVRIIEAKDSRGVVLAVMPRRDLVDRPPKTLAVLTSVCLENDRRVDQYPEVLTNYVPRPAMEPLLGDLFGDVPADRRTWHHVASGLIAVVGIAESVIGQPLGWNVLR